MRAVGVAGCLAVCAVLAGDAQTARLPDYEKHPSRIRVFVQEPDASADGFVDEDTKRLADSKKDLASFLKKQRQLVLVDDDQVADIVLRVLSSRPEPSGVESTVVLSPTGTPMAVATSEEVSLETVRVALVAGAYERVLSAQTLSWQGAARNIGGQVTRWARENRKVLLERRGAR